MNNAVEIKIQIIELGNLVLLDNLGRERVTLRDVSEEL